MAFNYPVPRRDESIIDEYHGTFVTDPYRWLEDPTSLETKQYVNAINHISVPYLEGCKYRNEVRIRLEQLWNSPKYSCTEQHGMKYFHFENSGLQDQNVLFVQESLDSPSRILLDPNTFSENGTISLTKTSFSEDGSILAYTLSDSGSDWVTIHFLNIVTEERLVDILEKVKFSTMSWTHDNKGIFYNCFPHVLNAVALNHQTVSHQKLYYHRIGTSQDDDILIVEFPNEPYLRIPAEVCNTGRWLIVTPRTNNQHSYLYFYDLNEKQITREIHLTQIVTSLVADYDYVTTEGSLNIFRTNKDAPNYRIIIMDFEHPGLPWKDLIKEDKKDVLVWACPVNKNQLAVCYLHNVCNRLFLHNLNGERIMSFSLQKGTIVEFNGEKKYSEIFFKFTSFLNPGTVYYYDLTDIPAMQVVHRKCILPNCNVSNFGVKQIFYPSSDQVLIPMFIVYHKNVPLNGLQPCILSGYGGFNISMQPTFNVTHLAFMLHMRGICALANIRGGGEYGDKWHQAGRQNNKQTSFIDFQSAAEFLIKEKYTNKNLLTIQGGRNGGLLVAACITQRPDLFGAAIAEMGVLDMLRYHKFTIGHSWSSDYGTSEDAEMFNHLMKYSPLHNISVPKRDGKGQYPALLLLTSDHDDRVVPMHSLKFIAELHHATAKNSLQTNPLMLRVHCKTGHGSVKPSVRRITEATDILCFILKALGLHFDFVTEIKNAITEEEKEPSGLPRIRGEAAIIEFKVDEDDKQLTVAANEAMLEKLHMKDTPSRLNRIPLHEKLRALDLTNAEKIAPDKETNLEKQPTTSYHTLSEKTSRDF